MFRASVVDFTVNFSGVKVNVQCHLSLFRRRCSNDEVVENNGKYTNPSPNPNPIPIPNNDPKPIGVGDGGREGARAPPPP